MNIILYVNNSEKNKIGKNLTNDFSLSGTLRDATNIINPVILIELNEISDKINALKLKHYYGAKLSPFACLIDNNGKHIQAFYSENKSFSLDYIKNVLDHWLLYNPIEDGNSGS